MDSVLISLHVEPPPDSEWEGYTYTPGFWKSPNGRRIFVDYLPVTIAGVTVPTVDSGVVILNRNRKSSSAWQKFLAFFLAMTFNYMTDESLLEAYYNDKSTDGEFMEGELVADIIDLADTYRSNTPEATLMAMKHVFDQMCNNSEHTVLWLNGDGGAGKTASLSTGNFITLNPNPFNNRTEIRFLTENKEPITLSVYDIKGAKVRDLVKTANSTLYWDGTDNNGRKLNRGIYIIRIHNTALKALISR